MRNRQVLTAFLIASLIMLSGVYGYWRYSVNNFISHLNETITKVSPGEFKVGSVEQSFDLFYTYLTLKDSRLSLVDPKRGSSLIFNLGDIRLTMEHFSPKRFKLELPEEVPFVTTLKNKSEDYRVTLLEPILDVKEMNGSLYTSFVANGFILQGRQNGYFTNLLKSGYIYVSKDYHRNEWSTVVNNLDLTRTPRFEKSKVISSFTMNWNNNSGYKLPLSYSGSALGMLDKIETDDMLMSLLKHMGGFFRMHVEDARIMFDDEWYSYNGEVAIDGNKYLDLRGVLTSNRFGKMLNTLREKMDGFPLALDRMMERLMNGSDQVAQSVNVQISNGVFSINGAPVGPVDDMPTMLHLHGRGL